MSAILDDDEDVLAGNTGERTVVVNPRELALQAIDDGRIREFKQESGAKVPAQPVVDEDMDADDVAAEQERARLQASADCKAAAASRSAPADDDQLQRQVQGPGQSGAPTVIDNFDNVVGSRTSKPPLSPFNDFPTHLFRFLLLRPVATVPHQILLQVRHDLLHAIRR